MNNSFIQSILNAKKGIGVPSFLIAKILSKSEKQTICIGPERELETIKKFSNLLGISSKIVPTIYDYNSATDVEKSQITSFLSSLCVPDAQGVFFIPADFFTLALPSPQQISSLFISIKLGSEIDIYATSRKLVETGYQREQKALEPGSFSIKGDLIEVFPYHSKLPLRIETEFGVIDKIYTFDHKKQQSVTHIDKVTVPPNRVKEADGLLYEHLPLAFNLNDARIVEIDTEGIIETVDPLEDGSRNLYENALSGARDRIVFNLFDEEIEPTARELTAFHASKDVFIETLTSHESYTKIILTSKPEHITALLEDKILKTANSPLSSLQKLSKLTIDTVHVIDISSNAKINLPKGFIDDSSELILATDKDLFIKKIKERRAEVDETFIASLAPGDYVVHIDHGIGRFIETVKRSVDEGMREFFLLEYGKGDKIYLPVEYADKIAKYVGEAAPKVNRLHEVSFKSIRQKIKEDARKIAKELIETQALRELHEGNACPKTKDEDLFMTNFPFVDTECQIVAWKEVQADLESNQPMDRLLCGDVGFGKTEIAMRAAFRVVSNGLQVGVLAPTTILAKQHYENFKKRFEGFNYNIQLLSRLQSPKKQQAILEELHKGKVDIIIGTHRLISKDVSFQNLGLIIVDEEQRFGVKAKEALKKMRSKADILTLTATPIPRTLHMSLSGLKHISTLTTPPAGRVPVKTIIAKRNDALIKDAIEKELEKGGQVFYLHNRVQTIQIAKRKLAELVPESTQEVVHGQLDPKQINVVMNKFEKGETDILVASSIIENGVDIPNVNTLIVSDATRFGLGQLYQLRGRIGRSDKKGHAYFLYNNQSLGGPAKERLKALLAAKKLGSGFEIAMKDLEIRGAGNILGKEQSGRVKTLGLSHYLKLLNTAIKEVETGEVKKEIDVSIDLPLNAFIPEELVENEKERLTLYQRLAHIESIEKLTERKEDLLKEIDSEELENLFYILELKLHAKYADIKNIDTKIYLRPNGTEYKRIVLTFDEKTDYKKAYEALTQFHFIEVEEKQIKMDFSSLGNNWRDTLTKIVSKFK